MSIVEIENLTKDFGEGSSRKRKLPSTWGPALLVVAVGVVALVPAMFYGIPSNRDLVNHLRFALSFYEAIQHGHIYPGWLAESNAGYGDASFRFYPPALYYLLALTRTLTGNWYNGCLLGFTLLSIVGAVGCYLWARTILPAGSAMWAAVFYTLAPYHINQFYQASLLGELAASAILPFSFLFVERICQGRRSRDIAGLAISFALLVLTHLPLTLIGSLALLLYALLRLPKVDRWQTFLRLAAAAGLGLTASASYWVTMLVEKSFIRADRIQPDPSVDYRRNFLFSTFSPDNLNVWWMNILAGFTLLMILPALALWWPGVRKMINATAVGSVTLVFTLAILMATQLSLPVWKMIHPLQETQFPWRWLAIASLSGSLLIGASLPFWRGLAQGTKRPLVLVALAGVMFSLVFSLSHTIREAKFLSSKDFETTLQSIPGSASVTQWLPVWASDRVHDMQGNVEISGRSIGIDSWEPERRTFHVAAGNSAYARIRTFYYPYWTATAAGRRLASSPAEDGALLVALPPEAASITLEFSEPGRVHLTAVITALSWLAIAALLIFGTNGKRRLFVKNREVETRPDNSAGLSPYVNN
jgi:hypothetical protein